MQSARLILAAAALVASHGVVPRAEAATSTTQMTVTATVLSSCALTGASLNFGEYVSGRTTNLDVDGQITYSNCSGRLTFELNGGQSGNINARAMRNGANSLNYQLFRNPTRTAIFGTGTNAQAVDQLTAGNGQVIVYGRIPAGQSVPAGTYTDTVTVTLTF
jgi:spore coat protein U-like protein